jgi:hypothetical protein
MTDSKCNRELNTNFQNKKNAEEETMKAPYRRKFMTAMLIVAAVCIMAPAAVWAAGTTAGTGITNSVSVNYSVGGVAGSAIVSSATFTVGMRVSMTVTRADTNFVDVAGGAANVYLTFVVSNTTNTRLDFGLVSQTSSTNPFNGAASNFVSTPTVTAFVDSNGNNVYDAGVDTAVFTALNSDTSSTIFVVGTIPAGEANGATQAYSLTAVARGWGSGAGATTDLAEGAGTYNSVDVVFGDAGNGTVAPAADTDRDARASDRSAFRISAITVSKTSVVYSDPFNGTSTPRYIPGAVITYTITIDNTAGTSDATSVSISDALGALPVTFATQFDDGVDTCAAGNGIVVNGACYTNAADGGSPDASFGAGTVTVSGMTVAAGTSARQIASLPPHGGREAALCTRNRER